MNNKFWQDRNVLVTGATGLVGSWLVKRLVEAGASVVCLVRDWVPQSEFYRSGLDKHCRIVNGDLCDQLLLERTMGEYEIKTVMHLAAQTIVGIANRNPVSTFQSNIAGTWSLLEACRRTPTIGEVVVASSDKAYGDCDVLPYTEETPLVGMHPYDVSKSCADLISQAYAKTYSMPVVVTRCGNFYGGGDLNFNRIIPGTMRSLLNGEAPVIRSNGKFIRDYFYVEDGAAAYMLLAEKLAEKPELKGHAFNFSNEIQLDVLQLVEKIQAALGTDIPPVVLGQASNEIIHQYLSAAKAREVLGWSPLFDLSEGLSRTIAWYRHFLKPSLAHVPTATHTTIPFPISPAAGHVAKSA